MPYVENPDYWQYQGEPVLLLGGWLKNPFNPANNVHGLAEPGKQYAVYFPDRRSVTLDLSGAPEALAARWIDIQKAEWTEQEPLRGGRRSL